MSARREGWCIGVILGAVILAFAAHMWAAQARLERELAASDARLAALRARLDAADRSDMHAQGTRGEQRVNPTDDRADSEHAIATDIRQQLQDELGLAPVRMLRQARDSFVELNAIDVSGKASYGTAGYLGGGYFITVKHVVAPLNGDPASKITAIKLRYKSGDVAAKVVDTGDARSEVTAGDWAIIKASRVLDLPALRVNTQFGYDFAEPIFRMGNDYSKGVMLSSGYAGQHLSNGLVTCLTDGHPGVSGGGILDQHGVLVGIPIGRMEGDYRFSFILPLRREMFRKVHGVDLD